MSPAVKTLHVEEMSSNDLLRTLDFYWSKGAVYNSWSILVKYDYLVKVVFIVNWKVSKNYCWEFIFQKLLFHI